MLTGPATSITGEDRKSSTGGPTETSAAWRPWLRASNGKTMKRPRPSRRHIQTGRPCPHSSAVPAAHSIRLATLHRLSALSAKTSASSFRPRGSRGQRWNGSGFRITTGSASTSRASSGSARSRSSPLANALLLCTPEGNILWDCISLIDDATVTLIKGLGGLHAIAISHPHFYTTLVDLSRAFGGVPVHLHANDANWVRQLDSCIKFWQGENLSC